MSVDRLLVANRAEIAIRVFRSAADLDIDTIAVYSGDDAAALHPRRATRSEALPGSGPAAYLDGAAILAAAARTQASAIHPGYGFLSENPTFARQCADAGLAFVGPSPEVLSILGDKVEARRLAAHLGIAVLEGSETTSLDGARAFYETLGKSAALAIKAVAGGGGRGIRIVRSLAELDAAWERCASEATGAFGTADLYVERLLPRARHIEIQVVGDHDGNVMVLGDRECSIQRRRQKILERAPAGDLPDGIRAAMAEAAERLAREVGYTSLGTVEFLVDAADPSAFWLLEANPRIQVEHTVTEAVTGLDLVRLQLEIARGRSLPDLGLDPTRRPVTRGNAVQARLHLEEIDRDGTVRPTAGTITRYEPPTGPGIRVDDCVFTGWATSPRFDPLIAKVIVHTSGSHREALGRLARALAELTIDGVGTNRDFLRSLLQTDEIREGAATTAFVDDAVGRIVDHARTLETRQTATPLDAGHVGAAIDRRDPLAVLDHGRREQRSPATDDGSSIVADGLVAVRAPLLGTVVSLECAPGALLAAGTPIVILEAMKMEHVIETPTGGVVHALPVSPGTTVAEGAVLATLTDTKGASAIAVHEHTVDLDVIRADLAESIERHDRGLDASRPAAVERRHGKNFRTARENIADLCDPGTFAEYGALAIALQRGRRSLDDLTQNTPADGLVCGLGHVNGDRFGEDRSRCAILSYDYTVLAGTQGWQNHRKKDRLFEIAQRQRLPLVFFTEGGGGRPGDVDAPGVAGLDCRAFQFFGELSGLVPLVGINSGRCFAGNAALLGCCDVIIATENSSIGMGGPAMIEGGGLGVFHPDDVGPMSVQTQNGVVDVAVRDEAEAVAVAKAYLAYFQGPIDDWTHADQRRLRTLIPENRLRIYDVRHVIDTMADTGSVLELRRGFGAGMVTALARIEGRPLGIVANHAGHLAGAIDPDGADKAARFMQLCDAFDLPILFLCDTPGFMVGPDVEAQAMVRRAGRLFVVGGSLSVPFLTIVLRKGYGLGAQAMAGGSFHAPMMTIAWPTGEFGGMGLEGAIKLGFRKELEAIEDPDERRQAFEAMVARAYEIGKAVNMASHFEIDDVIDPVDSRARIMAALRAAPPPPVRTSKKRPCVDAW